MDDNDSLGYMTYGLLILATLGLIFFIVNWIRCRRNRVHLEEYEPDENNKITMR